MKPYRFILSCLLVLAFCSCVRAQSGSVRMESMAITLPANKADLTKLAKDWYASKITGDFARMRNYMADDIQIFGAGDSAQPLTKEQYVELWQGYKAGNTAQSINDGGCYALTIPSGSEAGDWVHLMGEAHWTPEGGSEVVSWFSTMMKIKAGKIVMVYHFQDNLSILSQMGFTVQPPATAQASKQ